ncbi:MAG: HipA N-terminal domain-containing protein [Actinobacteria bacterium]|nr:HipA N-terminal domain-containing protein [Actinomycetota bacterium]
MTDRAEVYYNHRKAGILSKSGKGYEFAYYNDYADSKYSRPISKTMPLSRRKFYSGRFFPFFENLLPEGFLLELTFSKLKIDKHNKFELLINVGRIP